VGFAEFRKPQVVRSIRVAGSTPHVMPATAFDHIAANSYMTSSRLSRILKTSASFLEG